MTTPSAFTITRPVDHREAAETWRDQAVCTNADPACFYPEDLPRDWRQDAVEEALGWCSRCPARDACLADTLATETPTTVFGIRGGKTAQERWRILAKSIGYDTRSRP